MAKNNNDKQFVIDSINYALYDNFDRSAGIIAGARLVESMEEAKTLDAGDDFNRKYNRFDVFFFYHEKYFSSLECSLYLDRNMDKIYIILDDILNKDLRLADKSLPKVNGTLHYYTLDQDLEDFADNVLTPALVDYYNGSCIDIATDGCNILYPENGDLVGLVKLMSGIMGLKPINAIIDISSVLDKNSIIQSNNIYNKYLLDFNNRFYIARSLDGTYNYIFTNDYVWYANPQLHEFLLEDAANTNLLKIEV